MLQVSSLSVSYGAIHAVDAVSLDIPQGAIVTLIGANGAGKTSTLRALSGLLPASGRVTLAGELISGLPAHRIVERGLCHVPEGRMVFANLTVRENLAMGAYLDRNGERVSRNLERVFAMFPRLQERLQQQAGTLSGGEQQMLAIGRALMGNPRCLMLDEPSLGIAPRLVQSIFQQIVAINREQGLTILLVEQNARLALEVSSYAYVMEGGRVVMEGPSARLREDPAVKAAYLGA